MIGTFLDVPLGGDDWASPECLCIFDISRSLHASKLLLFHFNLFLTSYEVTSAAISHGACEIDLEAY